MKILLTNFHPHFGGGHTTYLFHLFRELHDQAEVYLACPATSKLSRLAKNLKPARVFDIDFPGKFPKEIRGFLQNYGKISAVLREGGFDIVHLNGTPDLRMIVLAKLLTNHGVTLIRTQHSSKKLKLHQRILDKLFIGRVIVVSRYQKNLFLKAGYSNKKVVVIPHGIDLDQFSPRPSVPGLREKYGIAEDDFVMVSTAGTGLHKGWQFLVEAISRLESHRDKSKIILAGQIPNESLRQTYIDKFNMNRQVIFTGLLPDTRDIVTVADIGFVLSIKIETISYACREMMAMAKPVLVSDYAGLPENVDDGENGWIAKSGDVERIYSKLTAIISKRQDLPHFSRSAREKAEQVFGLPKFISKTRECYESTLSREVERSKS